MENVLLGDSKNHIPRNSFSSTSPSYIIQRPPPRREFPGSQFQGKKGPKKKHMKKENPFFYL